MRNLEKLFAVAFIAMWFGISSQYVGGIPTPSTEPYSWWVPWGFLALQGIPSLLCYIAGRKDGRQP